MFLLHGHFFFFPSIFSAAWRLIFRRQKPSTYSASFYFFLYNHDGETTVCDLHIIPPDKYIEGLRQLGSLHSR